MIPQSDPDLAAGLGRRGLLVRFLAVAALSLLLCLPFVRAVFWMGDEGVVLHGAERLLQSKAIHIDFFAFLPPGAFVLTAAWFELTGISIGSARALALIVIAAIAGLIYLTCWQVSRHSATSMALAIVWVIATQGTWTQVSHHWFTTLFSMIAFGRRFTAWRRHHARFPGQFSRARRRAWHR